MYVPKNRILPNQYTRGGEYKLESNPNPDSEYIGFYHKLYTGDVYTGKTPQSEIIELLIPISEIDIPPFTTTPGGPLVNKVALSLGDADFFPTPPNGEIYGSIIPYLNIKSIETNSRDPKFLPSQYYPKPTEDDYKVGNFKRYFCVKANEDIYLELNQKTYSKLKTKSPEWAHELYTPFYIMWYITGEESQVESTNKNLVTIQQQRSRRKGLKEFLRENYTKFWIPQ